MERLLHYVWKYKLYASTSLATTEGLPIAVIDPGIQNTDAGPDFFNAKIKIDGTVWAGSVEIHEKASDWLLHHHDSDKAYDSVILHVRPRGRLGQISRPVRLRRQQALRRNAGSCRALQQEIRE